MLTTPSQTTPCKGKACDFDVLRPTCSICNMLNRPCTFTNETNMVNKLATGSKYGSLGLATNTTNVKVGAFHRVQIEEPFDPSLEAGEENI